MEKIPMEWVDKIFNCLEMFYVERWTKLFTKHVSQSQAKIVWQNALIGCAEYEIRSTLVLLKQAARNFSSFPPTDVEFYLYCKGKMRPLIIPPEIDDKPRDYQLARRTLDEINTKLYYRNNSLK